MTNKTAHELRPCLCGHYPVLVKTTMIFDTHTERTVGYACFNPDCKVKAVVPDEELEARLKWNTDKGEKK